MVRVFVKEINKLTDSQKDEILALLSPNALKRAQKKRDSELQNASTCALSLVADKLGKQALSSLSYEESGRPFLDSIDADISISHSKTLVAIAISDKKSSRVGVDVEEKTFSPEEMKKIARRFFSTDEQRILSESQDESKTFLEIWTKKEALKKRHESLSLISFDTAAPLPADTQLITRDLGHAILSLAANADEQVEINIVK